MCRLMSDMVNPLVFGRREVDKLIK
jgi:hypothetical protein